MALSSDLISQFVKMTKDKTENKKETIVYGTIQKDNNGNDNYVNIDGSNMSTPVSKTVVAGEGDRVTVMIKNHTATVTGNLSNPSARDSDKANTNELVASNAKIANLESDNATIKGNLSAQNADIENLKAADANITGRLSAHDADIAYLKALDIDTDKLEAAYAFVEDLEANHADVDYLVSTVADIDTLIFGSAGGDVIQTSFSNAVIAQLGDAQIKSAMIESVSANKITAGDIITNNVRVMSEDGKLVISDETLQISDGTRVRVQIGKDAASDYSINIWDQNGNLMFSKGGITDAAIKEAIIRNDMVSDTANIHASKLDIDSLFEEINDSSNTIKSTQIYVDDEKQTLDIAFKSLTTEVGSHGQTISSQGTAISTIQGQISSKIWQQDINTAKNEMSTQYSTLEQNLNGFKSTVNSTYATKTSLDNLEIGGKNLIRNSNFANGMWWWTNVGLSVCEAVTDDVKGTCLHFSATQAGNSNYRIYADTNYFKHTQGLRYTISFDAKTTDDNAKIAFSVAGSSDYDVVCELSASWKHFTHTYTAHADGSLTFWMVDANTNGYITNIKLERGDKATDWTPAPEDMEARISTAETIINQNSSDITSIASRTTNNESAISTLEQTADGLTLRLDNMKIGGRNLIVRHNETVGYYIGTDGSVTTATACSIGEYIAITPNTVYTFSKTSGALDNYFRYAWYTSDKTYISRVANSNNKFSWTSPSNAYYVRISYPTECKVKFEKGTMATDWSPAPEDVENDILQASKTATNYLNFSSSGLVIGNMTASTLGKNVLIDSDSVDIRNGTTTLASFGADYLYLAKNSRNATIDLCNGLAKLYHQSRLSYDTLFVIETPNATEIRGTSDPLCITSTVASKPAIKFANSDGVLGSIGMVASGTESYITRNHPSTAATYSILDTGNYYKLMDSGWINCSLNTGNFTRYNNDIPQPQVRKIGKQVYLRGEAKPVTSVTPENDSGTYIATIPEGYRPSERQQFIMQGSGSYRWMMSIHTDGKIAISRYSNSTTVNMQIAAGAWLCCHAQWLID